MSKLALAAPFLMTKLLVRSVRILVVYPCCRWLCARARNSQIVAMVAELSADHLRAAYYDRGCADGSDGDRCHPRRGGADTATTMPAVGRGVVDVARDLADLELSNAASKAPRRRVIAGQRLERTRAEVRFGIVS